MPFESAASLLDALRQGRFLDANQLTELARPPLRFPDARALARDLVQRGWLTPYQINQLFQGKGRDLVLGQYLILERLGEGGMGQVFKARQQRLNRVVALKVIRKDRLGSSETARRFQREVLAAAQLSHPNVVTAYDADVIGDVQFFAMEYVEGTDLSKLVREYGPLPLPLACNYIQQAACGLAHAHEKGLVHRDIKPSNLLVSWGSSRNVQAAATPTAATGRPVVKVLDMGLARLTDTEDGMTSELTQEGAVMGTVDYLAPEQAMDSRKADIRSDLYSLGCTFYFVLTGKVPYPGGTATEKLLKHRLDEPEPVEQLRPEVPPGLAAVVRKLMAKLPEDRYQTPAELIEVLSTPLNNLTVQAAVNGAGGSRRSVKAAIPVAIVAPSGMPVATAVPVTRIEEETQTSAFLGNLVRRRGLPLGRKAAIAAGLGAGLFLLLLVVVLWPRSRKVGPPPPVAALPAPEQATEADLQRLKGRLDVVDSQQLWTFLLAVQRVQAGKPQAVQAAELMTLLPSPLDRLKGDKVAAGDRAIAGSPDGLLAVIGEQRLRQWGPAGFPRVRSLAFSPDGKTLASGGENGVVRLWDTATGQQRRALPTRSRIQNVQIFQAGTGIAALEDTGRLRLWEAATGKELRPPARRVLALSPDGSGWVVADPGSPHLRVQLAVSGRDLPVCQAHTKYVYTAALSADARLVASVGDDPAIFIWEAATGKVRHKLPVPVGPLVRWLQWAGNGSLLLSWDSANGGTYRVWDVATEKERKSFPNNSGVGRIAPDGKALVCSGPDGVMRLWDVAAGKERASLAHGAFRVEVVAFSPDSRLVATGAGGGINSVKVWDAVTGLPRPALKRNGGPVAALSFTADGKTLAAAFGDGHISLWDTASGTPRLADVDPVVFYTNAQFSHDGRTLALLAGSRVHLVDTATAKPRARLTEHTGHINALAFAPDDLTLLTASNDGTAKLWDVASGQVQATLSHNNHNVRYANFTPDGQTVVSVDNLKVKLWRTANGQPRGELSLSRQNSVWAMALAPDGKRLAAGTTRGALSLWDLPGGKEGLALSLFKDWIFGLAWTPDGRALAARDRLGNLKLWDVAANKELAVFPASQVWAICPDSRTIALAIGNEGQLRAYDIATGQVKVPLEGHTKPVLSIAYSADARLLASADIGGRVIVWEPGARKRKLQEWQLPGAVQQLAFAPDGRHLVTVNSNGSAYLLRFAGPARR